MARAGQGRSNSETLFGITQIPSDHHIRDMLDEVAPKCFHPPSMLERGSGLAALRRFGHDVLIAFDGTGYYGSARLDCPYCPTRERRRWSIAWYPRPW
jgi:hypothetical protein